jgi:hypothetical protein
VHMSFKLRTNIYLQVEKTFILLVNCKNIYFPLPLWPLPTNNSIQKKRFNLTYNDFSKNFCSEKYT